MEGPDNEEYNSPPHCSDTYDNDSDGKIDYPADPGCESAGMLDKSNPTPPQPPPTSPAATDGRDTPGVARNESGLWRWYLEQRLRRKRHARLQLPELLREATRRRLGRRRRRHSRRERRRRSLGVTNGYDDIVDHDFFYGSPGDLPVVGDWNGDGVDTVGVVRGHIWHLTDTLSGAAPDRAFGYGNPGDKPVAGDWNGDGIDTPGVVRGNVWWLSNDFAATVWTSFAFGNATDQPLVGDWDGNGSDSAGVKREQSWYFSNGYTGSVDRSLVYGNPGDSGVAVIITRMPLPTSPMSTSSPSPRGCSPWDRCRRTSATRRSCTSIPRRITSRVAFRSSFSGTPHCVGAGRTPDQIRLP